MNGARECARRRRQIAAGRVNIAGGLFLTYGGRHAIIPEVLRPLAAIELDTTVTDVASVEIGLSAESISPQPDQRSRNRKPLTQEQKDRKNEQERARRAAAKARETVA